MTLAEELLEHLRRKGCAMNVARLAEDFKKPPQVIESNLALLRRDGRVQILRPGEWEVAPEKPAASELIPPAPVLAPSRPQLTTEAAALAVAEDRRQHEKEPRRLPTAASDHQETDMASQTKVCTECDKRKPIADFYAKQGKCKPCYNARQAKLKAARTGAAPKRTASEPRGGVAPKPKANGASRFQSAIDSLRSERDQLISRVSKIDAAIAQITALD